MIRTACRGVRRVHPTGGRQPTPLRTQSQSPPIPAETCIIAGRSRVSVSAGPGEGMFHCEGAARKHAYHGRKIFDSSPKTPHHRQTSSFGQESDRRKPRSDGRISRSETGSSRVTMRRWRIGWEAGIRTPITCSRGRCPTVGRPPSTSRDASRRRELSIIANPKLDRQAP
jgi:hypothetical protein